MEMSNHQVESLMLGGSGLVIPVLCGVQRSNLSREAVLRVLLFLQSVFHWFLILLPQLGVKLAFCHSGFASPRRRGFGLKKVERWNMLEEEDEMRRWALTERVEMRFSSEG